MRTASCLTLIAIGAIFTFAITGHPSFLNLQIAGVVIMATGVAGLFLPRRGQQGWLRRRTILRRGTRGPIVGEVDETRLPPYVMLNPGASGQENNGHQPGDLSMRPAGPAETTQDLPAADELAAEAEQDVVTDRPPAAASEIVEEYVEE
jgi:hypothetical protein